MNNQFSQKVSEILVYSKEEAERLGNNYIGPEHILLGLIRDGEGKAINLLAKFHVDLKVVKKEIESYMEDSDYESPEISYDELTLNDSASRILKLCLLEARLLKSNVADAEHILLAILKDEKNLAAEVLARNNVSYERAFEMCSMKPNVDSGIGLNEDEDDEADVVPFSKNTKQSHAHQRRSVNDTPVLDLYSVDLTKIAQEGRLDPVVGREKEIERLAQILSRRKKNNPILIGGPGVGKSAIVEGLACRIVENKASRVLCDKRVVALDMTAIVAGTKYRGQFEDRIHSILLELQKNPDVILFIDEIHTIIGAGSAPGTLDAANIIKPALARGELQCIGATTINEYRKTIEKDGALERRFQKILVEPTTAEETLQILNNIKGKYEEHHNVIYTDGAIEACVQLSERYLTERCFPDKAIDVLDEVGARAQTVDEAVPEKIILQEKYIEEAKQKKNQAVKLQNYELAASFRDRERELSEELIDLKDEWEESQRERPAILTEVEVAEVVSMMSGVPQLQMAQDENLRLRGMRDELKKKIISQDVAIDTLVRAVQRSRVGLKDFNRPIGVFMFLGPTGVGKTLLAKELAEYMFGSKDALIRIDMSEYTDKYSVSRMIGAPPGYIGYDEGGQLTEKVRRHPYSVILLDELEKAAPEVFNVLLQVLDEGRLTDGGGRTVDFKNTIIIMTSNVGSRQLKEYGNGIGFSRGKTENEIANSRSIIQKALNRTFAPEFINRIDELVMFNSLDKESIDRIVKLEIDKVAKRLNFIGYQLVVSEEVEQFIASKGYDMQYGARPLKRAIQTYLEDGISELLVDSGALMYEGTVNVVVDPEDETKLKFSVLKG